jgi:hypothetical protein
MPSSLYLFFSRREKREKPSGGVPRSPALFWTIWRMHHLALCVVHHNPERDILTTANPAFLRARHCLLQYFTLSQLRSHFLRQVNGKPHTTHTFVGKSFFFFMFTARFLSRYSTAG